VKKTKLASLVIGFLTYTVGIFIFGGKIGANTCYNRELWGLVTGYVKIPTPAARKDQVTVYKNMRRDFALPGNGDRWVAQQENQ